MPELDEATKNIIKGGYYDDVVNGMTNHERNKWARAGYPGLHGKDIAGPAAFVSPMRLRALVRSGRLARAVNS